MKLKIIISSIIFILSFSYENLLFSYSHQYNFLPKARFKSNIQDNSTRNEKLKEQNINKNLQKKDNFFYIKTLPKKEISTIEKNYYMRIKSYYNDDNFTIEQFGYNFFKNIPTFPFSSSIDSNYTLGPGDELFLYIIGGTLSSTLNQVNKLIVDREGKIYIPGAGVFYVWGLSLDQAEKLIAKALNANIKLTVGKLRTFPVYITGEVKKPGAVIVTGVTTVIDALIMAGGIRKTGTLRDVIITRKFNKKIKKIHLDLYNLFLKGEQINFRLKDNDIIFVPPIKKTAAVVGSIKKPGIYEFKKDITVQKLINIAGGLLPSSYKLKVILQSYNDNLFLKIEEGSIDNKIFLEKKINDGDILYIKEIVNTPKKAIKITGYTPYPGFYEYKNGLLLSKLLIEDFLYKDTNRNFAIIKRVYPYGFHPQYITFSPKKILDKKEDLILKPGDTITFFKINAKLNKQLNLNKIKDVVFLEGEVLYPGVYAFYENMKLSDILKYKIITLNTDLEYGEIFRKNLKNFQLKKIIKFKPREIINHIKDIKLQKLDIVRLYPKNILPPILISGNIEKPKVLSYFQGIKLLDALSNVNFIGDIKNLKVEIFRIENENNKTNSKEGNENIVINNIKKNYIYDNSSLAEKKKNDNNSISTIYLYDLFFTNKKNKLNISLKPGDRLLIKKISKNEIIEKVEIGGYVVKPGIYKIDENTTLYDILKKAGGFRKDAYPKGIIFTRKTIKLIQKQRLNKAILLMKKQLEKEQAGMMQAEYTEKQKSARLEAFQAKKRLLDLMLKTEVTGRVSGLIIPFDIEKLKNSISNILLENGDKIFVPKKPSSVLIFGEVYNPSALIRIKNFKVKDYIANSGGLTKDADKENIFVIKPNGTVITSSNMYKNKFWEGRNPKIWGIPFLFRKNIMNYKLDPGDSIIVPIKIHVPIIWRPLIKDVIQIIYQSALTVYTVNNLK